MEPGPLRGGAVGAVGVGAERVGGQGRRHPTERSQLDVVVVETAVEGHGLGGVEGGGELDGQRKPSEPEHVGQETSYLIPNDVNKDYM